MRIAVVDSHSDYDEIIKYFQKYLNTSLISFKLEHYETGELFLESATISSVDVVFIDVFIGETDTVDVTKKIRDKNPFCNIIFATMSKDFIYDSYDVNALYYLIKPFSYETFVKVMKLIEKNANVPSLCLEITVKRERIRIPIEDIFFVDLHKHYLQLHLENEVISTYTLNFKDIENTLGKYPNFVSCYRYLITNMNHISKIEGKDIIFTNNVRIPINRDRVNDVKKAFTRFTYERYAKADKSPDDIKISAN